MIDSSAPPLVSVITATYNRSNVLRYAIESVIAQQLRDWELIVVGDACTDDTAAVVASFADPRIRFVNLPVNAGEQSVPNNEGVRLSRGRYLAFLNHDDIWLPGHLATLVAALEASGADLVFSLMSLVQPDGTSRLGCAGATGRFEPQMTVPASSWLLRRGLAGAIGPWPYYRECYLIPSQEWLRRAHRAGKALVSVPSLGVIAIQSAGRPGSYADRQEEEHRRIVERMRREPDFVVRELAGIARSHALVDPAMGLSSAVRPYLARAARNLVRQGLLRLGADPTIVRLRLRLRRGALVDGFRRTRGLPARPRGRKRGI